MTNAILSHVNYKLDGKHTTVSVRTDADRVFEQRVFRDAFKALSWADSWALPIRDRSTDGDPMNNPLAARWESQLEEQANRAAMMHAYHPLTGRDEDDRWVDDGLYEAEMFGEALYHDRRAALNDLDDAINEFFS